MQYLSDSQEGAGLTKSFESNAQPGKVWRGLNNKWGLRSPPSVSNFPESKRTNDHRRHLEIAVKFPESGVVHISNGVDVRRKVGAK